MKTRYINGVTYYLRDFDIVRFDINTKEAFPHKYQLNPEWPYERRNKRLNRLGFIFLNNCAARSKSTLKRNEDENVH